MRLRTNQNCFGIPFPRKSSSVLSTTATALQHLGWTNCCGTISRPFSSKMNASATSLTL